MKYLVIDIETESKDYRKRFSDPFEKNNQIVMIQAKVFNREPAVLYKKNQFIPRDQQINLREITLLVGQNIRYDLLYLWNNSDLQTWLMNGGQIWDTKVIDYLIHGQDRSISYHLDDLSLRYGGKLKPDDTKSLYQEGLTTCQIIEKLGIERYKEYAVGDVINTEKVFLGQYDYMIKNNLSWLFKNYMRHYLAMLEIESNGLYIDKPLLTVKENDQSLLVEELVSSFQEFANEYFPKEIPFDINSNDHISALLFGGKFITKVKEPEIVNGLPVRYKTGLKKGEVKYKKKELELKVYGVRIPTKYTVPCKKKGFYATGDEILKNLSQHPFCARIQRYREENKLLTTYYKPFLEMINPYTQCVHSEFNLAGTRTARLSSKSPNIQNIHPTMLDCMKSRFKDGYIVEFDWKQLEVVLAALLSRDEMLLAQLANDIDMHMINAMSLFDRDAKDILPYERKLAKFLTFGILYGAGPKTMAKQHSIEESLAKQFIEQFYQSYPMIKQWHDSLGLEVEANKYIEGDKIYSYIRGYKGKRYHLEAYPAKFEWQKKKGIEYSFLPTECKNYPVQGFAADVVSFFVGAVYKYLQKFKKDIILINEVHDSLILDCSYDGLVMLKDHNMLDEVVQEVNKEFNSFYKGKALLVLEHKIGTTWGECKR